MKWKARTLDQLAEMICGSNETSFFPYRSSSIITKLFRDADTDYVHDGSTRSVWVVDALTQVLDEPHSNAQTPSNSFCRIINVLMDQSDAYNEGSERERARYKF